MKVEFQAGDELRLIELVATTGNAKQRDRYRVVLIAGRGLGGQRELEREQIAATVGRSRQFVDQWVGRYRTGAAWRAVCLAPEKIKSICADTALRANQV